MPFARKAGASPIYRTPEHRAARARLLEAFRPGDPCCLCDHPMWPLPDGRTSNLHADHCPACVGKGCRACGGLGYRGLAHGNRCRVCRKRCNQVDGARRGRARQEPGVTTLDW